MTCIAAIEHDGKVWIGGDSAGSTEHFIASYSEPKVWVDGEFCYGYCENGRYGALLRYSFKAPPVKGNIDKYLTNEFVPKLRECFAKDTELLPSDSGKYPEIEFLMGLRGRLYIVDCGYQIGRLTDGYAATGSGTDVAMGSLYSTKKEKDPRQRILTALRAAEHFVPSVRAPFHVVHTEAQGKPPGAAPKAGRPQKT